MSVRLDRLIIRSESVKLQDYEIIDIEFLFAVPSIVVTFLFLLCDGYGITGFIATISEILGQLLGRFRHAFHRSQEIGNSPRLRNVTEFVGGESNGGLEGIVVFVLDYGEIVDSSFVLIWIIVDEATNHRLDGGVCSLALIIRGGMKGGGET